jgi:hypothetical protein
MKKLLNILKNLKEKISNSIMNLSASYAEADELFVSVI